MNLTPRTAADETVARDVACSTVASILWRERELLDQLLYALNCQQFVLTSGGIRWVTASDAQVCEALDELTDCELRRAVETDRLAQVLTLPRDSTLDVIATNCEAPWDSMLVEHRAALTELVAEVATVTAHNRRLLRAGAEIVRDTLDRVSSTTQPYRGHAITGTALLFDRQI